MEHAREHGHPALAGWSGGDRDAGRSLPRQRLWVAGMVLGRFPVTNAEYIAFLNDLVEQGREADALRHVPQARAGRRLPGHLLSHCCSWS